MIFVFAKALLLRRNFSKFSSDLYITGVKNNFIEIPKIESSYNDKIIYRFIKRSIPSEYFDVINEDLKLFSLKMENEYYDLHRQCEKDPPTLMKYNGWGSLIDKIVTCSAWHRFRNISCEEGLVAIPYERHYKQYSRLYQGIKLILFSALGGLYGCPLAMTDGAAFVIQALNKPKGTSKAFENLVTRNHSQFWTSGQWMTEKNGGSDVASSTETVAVWDSANDCHRLYGYKWFTSATDADMALTLARSVDKDDSMIDGGKGLSLYYLQTKSVDDSSRNEWNHLEVLSLKDKLGTRQVPTAEILLNGSKALKLSEDGRGISSIAGMLTITRIHNAISSVSIMRRIVMLATQYAKQRHCFGSFIINKPLHALTLASLDVESRAAFYFVMDAMKLLGLQENSLASEEDSIILRILNPLVKLYTAKQAVSVASEGLECFGGQGYIETTGLPGLLRDAQVLPIWEGTTNILSLDLLRSLKKENLKIFIERCKNRLKVCNKDKYSEKILQFENALTAIEQFVTKYYNNPMLQLHCRSLAFALSRIYMGVLLLEQTSFKDSDLSDHLAVEYWSKKDLVCGLDKLNKSDSPENWLHFFK